MNRCKEPPKTKFSYSNIHISYDKIGIRTIFLHGAKLYFTRVGNTWYLITVTNINKINVFFSEIPQQIDKMYEKVSIITQIWHRAKCYFTSMSNALYLINVPNMKKKITTFFSEIVHKHSKCMKKVAIIS